MADSAAHGSKNKQAACTMVRSDSEVEKRVSTFKSVIRRYAPPLRGPKQSAWLRHSVRGRPRHKKDGDTLPRLNLADSEGPNLSSSHREIHADRISKKKQGAAN